MRTHDFSVTRIVLVVVFIAMLGTALADANEQLIWTLWDVRNSLNGTHTQTADINLLITDPNKIVSWSPDSTYSEGVIRKYTDGYAYYCSAGQATANTFASGTWNKMWEAAKGWEPIGYQSSTEYTNAFVGNYNGDGFTISNLYINRGATPTSDNTFPGDGTNSVGLFGFVSSNTSANNYIKGVKLTNVNITGKRGTGALVGKVLMPSNASRKTFVQNCSVNGGSVSGFGATGGLVGANNSDRRQQVPVIQYCWSNVSVSSTEATNTALNSGDNNNPYNIKYGGIVGCNETGITFDCYAKGAVSGGDRVGGIAGCTIDGAIIRCYSIGNVTQGIASSSWQGGVGGITGRIEGKLPPGLGGFKGSGSVQYCYYNSGITIHNAGGPVNTLGATSSSDMTTVPIPTGIYANWDFLNTWAIVSGVNDGYPTLRSNPLGYYYRTRADGNWDATAVWERSADNSTNWADTTIFPDLTSFGINIAHDVNVNIDVSVDQMSIDSGKTLTIDSGKRLYVSNNTETDDLTNNGTITVTGTLEVGQSAGFENKGTLTINGTFINSGSTVWTSGTATADAASTIKYNGALAQSTGTGFPITINNMEINNAAGVTFSNAFTINGTLTVTDGLVTGTSNTDGFHSVNFKRLEIAESSVLISGFSAATDLGGSWPTRIKRQWTINGTGGVTKTMTFYWDAADDNNFSWTGVTPALYVGGVEYPSTTGTDVSSNPRKLVVEYIFPASKNGSEATFAIGGSNGETLPVELSSFVAQVFQGNSVMLQWYTQSETNVSGFQIYRGVSEELTSALMLSIFVPATNTSQTQHYVYYDRELDGAGLYYYWLESVDFDGSSQFFGPLTVQYGNQDQGVPSAPLITGIARSYPNPFNPRTTLVYGLEKGGKIEIEIYNIRGQKIRSLLDESKQSGWYRLEWDGRNDQGSEVGSGVYYFRMRAEGREFLHKAVMMK